MLRSKGVELYNAKIEGLTISQPVIDDIVDQQNFEIKRYPDRPKSYEALRHDVALWHLVRNRRDSRLTSALDAVYWVVTIDYRFLGFDAHKGKDDPTALPVCVHPAVLLQMLQLWLPRDEVVDKAILQGIRSLLPQVFDSQAEEATVRILTALARYENVDDLDEATITQVLMSQALGDRIRMVDDVRQQVELVRDAIVSQFAETKAQLAAEQAKRDALESALAQTEARLVANAQRHGVEYDALKADRQSIQDLLDRETQERDQLQKRVATLEGSLRDTRESHSAMIEDRRRSRQLAFFIVASVASLTAAFLAGLFLPRSVASLAGMSASNAQLLVWTAALGIAGLGIWLAGSLLPTVREALWFNRMKRAMKWVVGTLWAIFLGIASRYIWERL